MLECTPLRTRQEEDSPGNGLCSTVSTPSPSSSSSSRIHDPLLPELRTASLLSDLSRGQSDPLFVSCEGGFLDTIIRTEDNNDDDDHKDATGSTGEERGGFKRRRISKKQHVVDHPIHMDTISSVRAKISSPSCNRPKWWIRKRAAYLFAAAKAATRHHQQTFKSAFKEHFSTWRSITESEREPWYTEALTETRSGSRGHRRQYDLAVNVEQEPTDSASAKNIRQASCLLGIVRGCLTIWSILILCVACTLCRMLWWPL